MGAGMRTRQRHIRQSVSDAAAERTSSKASSQWPGMAHAVLLLS
jgi:hypothetical protein